MLNSFNLLNNFMGKEGLINLSKPTPLVSDTRLSVRQFTSRIFNDNYHSVCIIAPVKS